MCSAVAPLFVNVQNFIFRNVVILIDNLSVFLNRHIPLLGFVFHRVEINKFEAGGNLPDFSNNLMDVSFNKLRNSRTNGDELKYLRILITDAGL